MCACVCVLGELRVCVCTRVCLITVCAFVVARVCVLRRTLISDAIQNYWPSRHGQQLLAHIQFKQHFHLETAGRFHDIFAIQLELAPFAPDNLRVAAAPRAFGVGARLPLYCAALARGLALARRALHGRCVCVLLVCLRARARRRARARASKSRTRSITLYTL